MPARHRSGRAGHEPPTAALPGRHGRRGHDDAGGRSAARRPARAQPRHPGPRGRAGHHGLRAAGPGRHPDPGGGRGRGQRPPGARRGRPPDRHRVCSLRGQATEIASPVIARLVTGGHGRARLDAVDTPAEVFDQVRQGRADVGVTDLPAPVDLWVTSLGWQEIVLMHPPRWELDDPLDVRRLDGLPLLSPGSDDWRHRAVQDHLRALGPRASITAEAGDSELMLELVLAGAGAWFVYGHDAEAARAAGAGVVHLRPTVVREVGVVAASEPAAAAARAFVEAARAETAGTLL